MYVTCFDMFKVGIGPSSSHTLGPMKSGARFVELLRQQDLLVRATRVQVDLYGSLSLTGAGHGTDSAVIMGLMGEKPETVDIDAMPQRLVQVRKTQRLQLLHGMHEVDFWNNAGVVFHDSALPLHENGMTITAFADAEVLLQQTYYSVGGGFIVEESEFGLPPQAETPVPFPYESAAEVLGLCNAEQCSIPELEWRNEIAAHSAEAVRAHCNKVWAVMQSAIERGCAQDGVLPGNLLVPRRAKALKRRLAVEQSRQQLSVMSWLNLYAFAVSEENAAGGRVVTAPTNGACGILPAVLKYWDTFIAPIREKDCRDFLLTAKMIGALYKKNASISGAEVGCQGEVGVACSMAAGGLAQLMGATPEQVCVAAEIGMEHSLGLTCDPVLGQVQVPCIERNAVGAVEAFNAANMAMLRGSDARVSLDQVIQVMYQTGKDMKPAYRETSLGGLATVMFQKLPPCG